MGNSPEGDTTAGFEQLGERDKVGTPGVSPAARARVAALNHKAKFRHQQQHIAVGIRRSEVALWSHTLLALAIQIANSCV